MGIFGLKKEKNERTTKTNAEISILEKAARDAQRKKRLQHRQQIIIAKLLKNFKAIPKLFSDPGKGYISKALVDIVNPLNDLGKRNLSNEKQSIRPIITKWGRVRGDLDIAIKTKQLRGKTPSMLRIISEINGLFDKLSASLNNESKLNIALANELSDVEENMTAEIGVAARH